MLVFKTTLTSSQDHIKQLQQDKKQQELDHQMEIARLNTNHELEIKELKSAHQIEIKQQDYLLTNVEAVAVRDLLAQVGELKQALAVMTKENEMNKAIINIEGDVLEVKDVVKQLIDKLPSINLNALTVQAGGTCAAK